MKPKEKAEGESRRRSRRPDKKKKKKRKKQPRDAQCLPATGKSGEPEKHTKKPNTRRRIQRKRRRNPAAKGTLIILPRLGSAPRCRTPRCVEYSSSEEALRRSISSARRFASIATGAIGRVFAFVERFRLCFTLRRCIYLCLGPFLYLGMTYHDFF